MLESISGNKLEYKKLTPEEMKSRGILGRLVGICCDILRPTRNGRLYPDSLWEKVFDSPLVNEQFEAGGIFGELTHPDREEVDLEKAAILMPEKPKKDKDGHLVGYWDILDTPSGRILKTLCDYGYKVGISTRGSGEIIQDFEGNETVDEDTYTLNAMDIVIIPAVKQARLQYVTESLNNRKSLVESLNQLMENETEDHKKIMRETIDELGITEDDVEKSDLDPNADKEDNTDVKVLTEEDPYKEIDDMLKVIEGANNKMYKDIIDDVNEEKEKGTPAEEIKEALDKMLEVEKQNANVPTDSKETDESIDSKEDEEVGNTESKIIEDLQETLRENKQLKAVIEELQNKLSVCYAKETKLKESLSEHKAKVVSLIDKCREAGKLNEELSALNKKLKSANKSLNESYRQNQQTKEEEVVAIDNKCSRLTESLEKKTSELRALKESYTEYKKDSEQKLENLSSQIVTIRSENEIKADRYEKSIRSLKESVNKYKKLAEHSVDKYIGLQATKLGVSKEEIRNRLTENYSYNDIDRVCDKLSEIKLNISSLPFNVGKSSVRVTESMDKKIPAILNPADELSDFEYSFLKQ